MPTRDLPARLPVDHIGAKPPKTTAGGPMRWRVTIERKPRRSAWPAIKFQSIAFLILAERGAREHAGFAVDLVVIIATRGEQLLHAIEICSRQLHDIAPRCFEWPRVGEAIAQMADEQHIKIGKIIFLDRKIVFGGQERRAVKAGWLQ